jgi:hypothetical protein
LLRSVSIHADVATDFGETTISWSLAPG